MTEFKVGDKVKAIKACDGESIHIGKNGVVIDTEDDDITLCIKVEFEDVKSCYTIWWCERSSLVHSTRFEIGDRVKCINKVDGNTKVKDRFGEIIGRHNRHGDKCAVEFESDSVDGHSCMSSTGRRAVGIRGFYVRSKDLVKSYEKVDHDLSKYGKMGEHETIGSTSRSVIQSAKISTSFCNDSSDIRGGYDCGKVPDLARVFYNPDGYWNQAKPSKPKSQVINGLTIQITEKISL